MQENTIEIDSELYERLAIWSKECGQDDINEFIINLLLSAAKQDQEIEKRRKERGKQMKNEKNKMKKVEKIFVKAVVIEESMANKGGTPGMLLSPFALETYYILLSSITIVLHIKEIFEKWIQVVSKN
jgi:hypothetical protein